MAKLASHQPKCVIKPSLKAFKVAVTAFIAGAQPIIIIVNLRWDGG